jgi:hypothetical protein
VVIRARNSSRVRTSCLMPVAVLSRVLATSVGGGTVVGGGEGVGDDREEALRVLDRHRAQQFGVRVDQHVEPSGYRRYPRGRGRSNLVGEVLADAGFTLDEVVDVLRDFEGGEATCSNRRWRLEKVLERIDGNSLISKASGQVSSPSWNFPRQSVQPVRRKTHVCTVKGLFELGQGLTEVVTLVAQTPVALRPAGMRQADVHRSRRGGSGAGSGDRSSASGGWCGGGRWWAHDCAVRAGSRPVLAGGVGRVYRSRCRGAAGQTGADGGAGN